MRNYFFIVSAVLLTGLAAALVLHHGWHSWLVAALILPVVGWGLVNAFQAPSNPRRTYPIFGSLSEMLEKQRHVLQEVLLLDRIYRRVSETEVRSFAELYPDANG